MQWAGSCWYYLRFIDPRNSGALVDKSAEKYWMPVDLYVGGAEHAVLHLLYARFWHKASTSLCLGSRVHTSGLDPVPPVLARYMILGGLTLDPRLGAEMSTEVGTFTIVQLLPTPECLYRQVLYDMGVVSTVEPFQRLVSQGMILGEVEYTVYQDPNTGAAVAEDAAGAVPVR